MSRSPALLEMISGLIATPSVSSVNPALEQGNLAVIELLANWLEDSGFDIEIMPLPGTPARANLIATLGRGSGGLVLSGHTDTVPYDEGKWHYDPFRLRNTGNRLYGLGTSDMKSFMALALEAIRDLDADHLQQPLILLATADEETSMAGARALVERQRPQARYAVIGEPTGLRPVRMHKGILMEAIRLCGKSGHSSDPAQGNSALEAMHSVLGTLISWRKELQATHRNSLFAVPVPTLNLGHIHGGDNPNRICGSCELHLDLRPLPGMDLQELRDELRHRVLGALQDTGIEASIESLFEGIPAMETPANARIVQLTEKLTGHTPGAVAFGTEAPYLSRLGMETVILGPGDIAQAHQPDEYIRLDQLAPTVDLLKSMIDTVCIKDFHLL
ncbi:MAG TPA: acetylornithine deacetylase [Gammaproteobacteria bacterium]|nr:acetylornithine deacetylase [Gammaproteobacteria bacterium]